jgi:hypothetical protein
MSEIVSLAKLENTNKTMRIVLIAVVVSSLISTLTCFFYRTKQ